MSSATLRRSRERVPTAALARRPGTPARPLARLAGVRASLAPFRDMRMAYIWPSTLALYNLWFAYDGAKVRTDMANARALGFNTVVIDAYAVASAFPLPVSGVGGPTTTVLAHLSDMFSAARDNPSGPLRVGLRLFSYLTTYTGTAGDLYAFLDSIYNALPAGHTLAFIQYSNEPLSQNAGLNLSQYAAWTALVQPYLRARFGVPLVVGESLNSGTATLQSVVNTLAAAGLNPDAYGMHCYLNNHYEYVRGFLQAAQAVCSPVPLFLEEYGAASCLNDLRQTTGVPLSASGLSWAHDRFIRACQQACQELGIGGGGYFQLNDIYSLGTAPPPRPSSYGSGAVVNTADSRGAFNNGDQVYWAHAWLSGGVEGLIGAVQGPASITGNGQTVTLGAGLVIPQGPTAATGGGAVNGIVYYVGNSSTTLKRAAYIPNYASSKTTPDQVLVFGFPASGAAPLAVSASGTGGGMPNNTTQYLSYCWTNALGDGPRLPISSVAIPAGAGSAGSFTLPAMLVPSGATGRKIFVSNPSQGLNVSEVSALRLTGLVPGNTVSATTVTALGDSNTAIATTQSAGGTAFALNAVLLWTWMWKVPYGTGYQAAGPIQYTIISAAGNQINIGAGVIANPPSGATGLRFYAGSASGSGTLYHVPGLDQSVTTQNTATAITAYGTAQAGEVFSGVAPSPATGSAWPYGLTGGTWWLTDETEEHQRGLYDVTGTLKRGGQSLQGEWLTGSPFSRGINGSFENTTTDAQGNVVPAEWCLGVLTSGHGVITASSAGPHSGSNCLAISNVWNSAGGLAATIPMLVGVQPGNTFSLSGWMKIVGGALPPSATAKLSVVFFDVNSSVKGSIVAGTYTGGGSPADTGGVWQQVSASGTVPAGSAFALVTCAVTNSATSASTYDIFFDDIVAA